MWNIITAYPNWPSPYFAQFDAVASTSSLQYEFVPTLPSAFSVGPGDIVNLHRLKRLYKDPTGGGRTSQAAAQFIDALQNLQLAGAKIVWTMHNPYPIDGGEVTQLDVDVTDRVLALVDHVITHTEADADGARDLGRSGPISVAGWAGMPSRYNVAEPAEEVSTLMAKMRSVKYPILMLGNWTPYKAIPEVMQKFVASTEKLHLFVVGPCRDEDVRQAVYTAEAELASDRIFVHEGRVEPSNLFHLFGAASACICNYDTSGSHWFFRKILHPSSVSSAVVFGVPLVAPSLPGVKEISTGRARALYPYDGDISEALVAAESAIVSGNWNSARPSLARAVEDDRERWTAIISHYTELAQGFQREAK